MITGYTDIQNIAINGLGFSIGENKDAEPGKRFVLSTGKIGLFLSGFCKDTEDVFSDNYMQLAEMLGERVLQEALMSRQLWEKFAEKTGGKIDILPEEYDPVTKEDNLVGKVVVLNPDLLGGPEFRLALHQIVVCTGGLGAGANAKGKLCDVRPALYDTASKSVMRASIIGIVKPECIPEWVQMPGEKGEKENE